MAGGEGEGRKLFPLFSFILLRMEWVWDAEDQTWTVQGKDCTIWMATRPHYCDRGNWLAHLEPRPERRTEWGKLSIDWQDLWPRYYFDLDRAKAECEAWLTKRGQAL